MFCLFRFYNRCNLYCKVIYGIMCEFFLGLFMGLGDCIIVCGMKMVVFGMVLWFLVGLVVFVVVFYLVGFCGVLFKVFIV